MDPLRRPNTEVACPDPAMAIVGYRAVSDQILEMTCAILGCHGALRAAPMSLFPGEAYGNLVGVGGGRMPLGFPMLDATEIALITDWILSDAPCDDPLCE